MTDVADQISHACATAIAGQRGNSISWSDVALLIDGNFGVSPGKINFGKVSSREENYYVRLNQSGFRKPLALGVLIAVGVPFSSNVHDRLRSKVSPHPKWPLLIIQDVGGGRFEATDLILGASDGAALAQSMSGVWPTLKIHKHDSVWSGSSASTPHVEITASEVTPLISLLRYRKNVVLEGVPGTGKSYALKAITEGWQAGTGRPLATPHVVVLHPSSSYEDLIEGLRPGAAASTEVDYVDYVDAETDAVFRPHLGRFTELCQLAAAHPDHDFLLVLDELNRANVPKALGELLLVMDRTKRATWDGAEWNIPVEAVVRLTYTGARFWVPSNVHILGTMNTTDRSVAPLDAALRRRFDFVRIEPMRAAVLQAALTDGGECDPFVLEVLDVWNALNENVLRPLIGPDAVLGHSYLFELAEMLSAQPAESDLLKRTFLIHTLLPQLVESVAGSGREDEIFGGDPGRRPTAVQDLDDLFGDFGLSLVLQGDGMGRRIVLVETSGDSTADDAPESE